MRYLFFTCFTLFCHLLAGQVLKLKEVMFHVPCSVFAGDLTTDQNCAGQEAGWVQIKSDENVPLSAGAGGIVAWKKSGNSVVKKPVAYVSGFKGRVSAKFTVPTNQCLITPIYVKGEAGGYTLRPQWINPPVGPVAGGSTGSFAPQAFEQEFPAGKVQCFDEFVIKWYYTFDPNAINPLIPNSPNVHWTLIGESSNLLLVTHTKPIKGVTPLATPYPGLASLDAPTTFFLTSLFVSCQAANGKSNKVEIVNSIYNEFADRCVKKYGGTNCMSYWGGNNPMDENIDTTCRTIQGFLQYEDARCGEWARFFNDMIKMQGISGSNVTHVYCGENLSSTSSTGYLPPADVIAFHSKVIATFGSEAALVTDLPNARFLVKNWILPTEVNQLIGNFLSGSSVELLNHNLIAGGDFAGMPAQGRNNPQSFFGNHALVFFNGKFYDPSYGTTPVSESVWKINSVDAAMVGKGIYAPAQGLTREIIWIKESLNLQLLSIHFIY